MAEASTDATRKIALLRSWAARPGLEYLAEIANEFQRVHDLMVRRYNEISWRPIAELYKDGQYDHANDSEAGLLLLAPELVDLDCNVHGIGMGYFQDGPVSVGGLEKEEGAWFACKWDMSSDYWYEKACYPTHYARINGVG